MAKSVAKKESTELAQLDYSAYANQGTEEATAADYSIPFLSILQALSPQLNPSSGSYIEDAKAGDIFNTVTQEVYKVGEKPLRVLPCYFQKLIIEWKIREQGGGLVSINRYDQRILDGAKLDDKKRLRLPNGNHVVDTRQHFCVCHNPQTDQIFKAVIAMASSQAKKSRRWLSIIDQQKVDTANGRITPPSWAYWYLVDTVPESNAEGSWSGWRIMPGELQTDPELFQESARLYEAVREGLVRAAPVQEEGHEENNETAEDDIPF